MAQSLKRISTSIRQNLPFSSPGGANGIGNEGQEGGGGVTTSETTSSDEPYISGVPSPINTLSRAFSTNMVPQGTPAQIISATTTFITNTVTAGITGPYSPVAMLGVVNSSSSGSPAATTTTANNITAANVTAFPDYIQYLIAHYKQQEKIVTVVEKCRRDKQGQSNSPLTAEEAEILMKKYEYFLLGSDVSSSGTTVSGGRPRSVSTTGGRERDNSLLSNQQKMNRIMNTIRTNASTLIEEMELLAIICKDLYDASQNLSNDLKYCLKPYYTKLQSLVRSIFLLREQRFVQEMTGRSDIHERTTLVRNYIVSMNNLIETYQSHLDLVFDSHTGGVPHSSSHSPSNTSPTGASGGAAANGSRPMVLSGINLCLGTLSDDDDDDDEEYDDDEDDQKLGQDESKAGGGGNRRKSRGKSLRMNRQSTGRTKRRSGAGIASASTPPQQSVIPHYGTINHKNKQQVIDLSKVYIESVDFGELYLINVYFGSNKVKNCNFLSSQITAEQLCQAKGLSEALLDEELKEALITWKYEENKKILSEMKRIIQEAKDTLRCLEYFPRLVVNGLSTNGDENQSKKQLQKSTETELLARFVDVSTDDLRRIVMMILTDSKINPLDDYEKFGRVWMVEHEEDFAATSDATTNDGKGEKGENEATTAMKAHNKDRELLEDALRILYQRREYYLPEEVIALSMDQKIINCTFTIDSPLLYINDIRNSFSFFPDNIINQLNNMIEEVNVLKEEVATNHQHMRQENETKRVQIFLSNLNDRIDNLLGYGPTDRLQHLLEIVRGTKTILDLRQVDLSKVNFASKMIDFTNVYTCISKEQEKLYLMKDGSSSSSSSSSRLIEQRYSLLYQITSNPASTIEDLDYLLLNCHLDVNRPELPDSVGRTALMHACFLKRMDLVVHLVEKYGARHDIKTKTGWDVISQLCSMRGTSQPVATSDAAVEEASDSRHHHHHHHHHSSGHRSDVLQSPPPKSSSTTKKHTSTGSSSSTHTTPVRGGNTDSALSAIANSKRIDPKCLEIATYLVEHGAFLSVHNAANLGDLKHLKKFHRSELLIPCPATGDSVAHIASRDNNVEILRYLKSKAFDFRTTFDNGPSCLWIACESSSHEAAIELIHYCPELREIPFKSKTPIKVALENKDFALVKKLKNLQCRADIEVAIALEDDHWIRQHLNDIRNANVKMEQQKLALLYACKYGWEKLVKHLVEECEVDLNDRYPSEQSKRVIDIVCSLGNVKLMKLLLSYVNSKRFNLNESTASCPTLLFTAIMYKHWEIVSLILDYKPDLLITGMHNRTPLHEVLLINNDQVRDSIRVSIVKKMLDNGVNVLAVDNTGCTALHYAASISEDMVMLILKGYIGHKNKNGKDALDFAQEANQEVPSLKL